MRSTSSLLLLLLLSCSRDRVTQTPPSSELQPPEAAAPRATASPYPDTPFLFLGLDWGTQERVVRDSLAHNGFLYEGGTTPDDRHIDANNCTSSLRPQDVSEYTFKPDSALLAECMSTPVSVAYFTGRVLRSIDRVTTWYDEDHSLIRLIVTSQAFSGREADKAYSDIRSTLVDRYGPPVEDSLTNGKDISIAASWWDSAGHAMHLELRDAANDQPGISSRYGISVDYFSPSWDQFAERHRQARLSTFR